MNIINVDIKDYSNAPDGSILVSKNGKWVLTTFEELNKDNKSKLEKIDNVENQLKALERNNNHFVVYAKSHFLVVYNYFKIKILSGELDVLDEELLKLDEYVLSGKMTVEEAIHKHDFLLNTFNQVYLDKKEMVEFPEV